MRKQWVGAAALLLTAIPTLAADADADAGAGQKTWSNETELSFVATDGNSNTQTLGFKETLQWKWPDSQFRLKLEALRSATSDDWYQRVDPGFTWEPGATPPTVTSTLVKPGAEPDAENYFAERRYERSIRKSLNWHAGLSWDRNEDAGILHRTIAFGGVGNQ